MEHKVKLFVSTKDEQKTSQNKNLDNVEKHEDKEHQSHQIAHSHPVKIVSIKVLWETEIFFA